MQRSCNRWHTPLSSQRLSLRLRFSSVVFSARWAPRCMHPFAWIALSERSRECSTYCRCSSLASRRAPRSPMLLPDRSRSVSITQVSSPCIKIFVSSSSIMLQGRDSFISVWQQRAYLTRYCASTIFMPKRPLSYSMPRRFRPYVILSEHRFGSGSRMSARSKCEGYSRIFRQKMYCFTDCTTDFNSSSSTASKSSGNFSIMNPSSVSQKNCFQLIPCWSTRPVYSPLSLCSVLLFQ
mmetsp:Transcript_22558/g.57068  ORF Transcript_22558/g.57068 Transcript_22558/m.57068 type:complete len:237 (-) Transcript_22558:972-1682(-)